MAVQRPRQRGRPWRPLLAALGQGFSLLHSVAQPVFKGGGVSTPHDGGGCTVRAQLRQRSWWFLLAAPSKGRSRLRLVAQQVLKGSGVLACGVPLAACEMVVMQWDTASSAARAASAAAPCRVWSRS